MKYRNPLKRILTETRSSWDHDENRHSVRRAFASALQCRTAELGAEVYASDSQEFIHYHTCKSRACTSCGNRASIQWRRERWAALPTQSYHGITFTMPNVLWPLFRDNPALTRALAAAYACGSKRTSVLRERDQAETRAGRSGSRERIQVQSVRERSSRRRPGNASTISPLFRTCDCERNWDAQKTHSAVPAR
jgi:hypothetical protein